MGYYDGNTVTALWNYAQHYAMNDHSFSTNFGPSTPGAINLISGQTNGVINTVNPGSAVVDDGTGGLTLIGDADPTGDMCSSTTWSVSMSGKNIGDLLNAANITWGFFEGGFDLSITNPNGTTGCRRSTVSAYTGTQVDYSPHHQPFQYYASTANLNHNRPTSIAAIGTTDTANHQYDMHDFTDALAAGNMPAVSFLKAPRYQDAHAANSDPIDEQTFIVNTINAIEKSTFWSSTAIIIAYDDSDGWYDHLIGLVNGSATTADNVNGAGVCISAPLLRPRCRVLPARSRAGTLRLRTTSAVAGHLSLGEEELDRLHRHRPGLDHALHRGHVPHQPAYRPGLLRHHRGTTHADVRLQQRRCAPQPQCRPTEPQNRAGHQRQLTGDSRTVTVICSFKSTHHANHMLRAYFLCRIFPSGVFLCPRPGVPSFNKPQPSVCSTVHSGLFHKHRAPCTCLACRTTSRCPPAPTPNPPLYRPPMLPTLALAPFVDALPLPEVIRPTLRNGQRSINVTMQEIHAKVHRDVPSTRMWSYGPNALAPLIEARAGEPLQIRWVNNLPTKHFLPIDYSLHGCGHDVPDVRATAHLHGAKSASKDDGYPEDWFIPGQSRVCPYPLQQDATALWFHDHAMGINRLNTYAGLFGMLLLRDKVEDALHLPSGKYEVPLIFYDRDFGLDGQIFYDVSGDPENPWIPEFSADGILINGKIRPYFEVEPRLYRFRLLNTANSRFFLLSLSNGQPLTQIGSDQGLLASPVEIKRLILGCAERADILIDFMPTGRPDAPPAHRRLRHPRVPRRQTDRSSRHWPPSPKPSAPSIASPNPRRPRPAPSLSMSTRTGSSGRWSCSSTANTGTSPPPRSPSSTPPKFGSSSTSPKTPTPCTCTWFVFRFSTAAPSTPATIGNQKTFVHSPCRPPEPNELGWKDTVQCPPGTITRIIVRFEGYPGKYLYHCHILEHESNDMMRPFEVIA